MTEMTRAEHMAWCKRRALAYVDAGELANAVASMASDMSKHPDTDTPANRALLAIGTLYVMQDDAVAMRRLIEGFAE